MDMTLFDRLEWLPGRVLLGEIVFRLKQESSNEWSGEEHILLHKTRALVDQFQAFFKTRKDFRPSHVLELGILDGGSIVLWHELLAPDKHVAIDLEHRADNAYFRRYVESRGLTKRIRTYWKTGQADERALRQIVHREFAGSIDMVIDDASHMYEETKASFEILFPYLSQGGIYLIEDWAWSHWDNFLSSSHPWYDKPPLSWLIFELIEAGGSSQELIRRVEVFQGFAAAERGPLALPRSESFHLADYIKRRSPADLLRDIPGPFQAKRDTPIPRSEQRSPLWPEHGDLRRERFRELERQVAVLEQELDVIQASKSWRWTRPLREAMATVRQLLRKG